VPTELGWVPALLGLLCLAWAYRPDFRQPRRAA